MDINESIKTELHYKDIVVITTAIGEYQRLYKESMNKEIFDRMTNLVNRLGTELYTTKNENRRTAKRRDKTGSKK